VQPKSYDAELISAMLDGNAQPKVCGDCLRASAALTSPERWEKLKEGAAIVCRKWLLRAPIADTSVIASLGATDVSDWEKSQLKAMDVLAKECTISLALGGGFYGEAGFKLSTAFRESRIVEQLKVPYANSIRKVDSDGEWKQWYDGSIFRRDDPGTEFIITWRKGELKSWG
jgi:hypothetical protein